VFGTVAGGDGPQVWIIDHTGGQILDGIGSRDAMVSPDQHWLVYRKFYPRNSEWPSEEYLLYDLTKDKATNRLPSEVPQEPNPPGRQIYPVTSGHVPFNNIAPEIERVHEFVSESFFWSADSKFVAFADRFLGTTSIVFVAVGEKSLTTYSHALVADEILCGGQPVSPQSIAGLTLHRLEFGPSQVAIPDVSVYFGHQGIPGRVHTSCNSPLRLHATKLRQAQIEVHKRLGK